MLADGSAIRELPFSSDDWLESEVLSLRGEAVLLEPAALRRTVAARAKALAKELGVERLRAPA
jgi:predicted DNA-binding transcriptional regulator YafY